VIEDIPSFVAECFWPGVHATDLHALDARALAEVASLTRAGEDVRYLGSILLRDDEVVLCRFQGAAASVRRAVVKAEIPFARILEAAQSPWPLQ
jgi:hypothetical protein